MKSLLFIIAGLLVVIWVIVFQPSGPVHLILVLAGIFMLIAIIYKKKKLENHHIVKEK